MGSDRTYVCRVTGLMPLVGTLPTGVAASPVQPRVQSRIGSATSGIHVDGGSEFAPSLRRPALTKASLCMCSRRKAQSSTMRSNALKVHGATSSIKATNCQNSSPSCSRPSITSPIASTTRGLTRPLAIAPRQSISLPSATISQETAQSHVY
jgi:hypothetical protein